MKKILISVFKSSIIVSFILNITPYLKLNLNHSQIIFNYFILFLCFLLFLLLLFYKVKGFSLSFLFKLKKINLQFYSKLIVINILFTFFFTLGFVLKSNGSFFTFTDKDTPIYWEKNSESSISGKFKAIENNVGIIKINTNQLPIDQKNEYLTFELREENSANLLYEAEYNYLSVANESPYPFGFEPINNSKNKYYYIEISSENSITNFENIFNQNKSIQIIYSFSKTNLVKKLFLLPNLFYLTLKTNPSLLFVVFIGIIFASIEILLLFKLKKNNLDNRVVSKIFILYLIKIALLQFFLNIKSYEYQLLKDQIDYISILIGFSAIIFGIKLPIKNFQPQLIDKKKPIILLITGIILFIIVRIPYLNSNLHSQLHADKNSSYLPNLLSMVKSGNIFENTNNAYSSFFSNEKDVFRPTYGEFPFFSWSLFPFFKILNPYLSTALILHLSLTFYGILFLILCFYSIKKHIGEIEAGILIILFASNPIFQLISFITVMDFPALAAFLMMLVFFTEDNKKSALWGGISLMMKLSFGLIVLPFVFYEWWKSKDRSLIILTKLATILIYPTILFNIFINHAPSQSKTIASIFTLIFFLLIFYGLKIIDFIFSLIFNLQIKFKTILLIVIFTSTFLFISSKASLFLTQFLTDLNIAFSFRVYYEIFRELVMHTQVLPLIVSIIGMLFLGKFRTKQKVLIYIMMASSIIYLFVGLKVIYFHAYYKHIFVFLVLIITSILCNQFIVQEKRKSASLLFIFVFISTYIFSNVMSLDYYMDRKNSDITEIARYLGKNLSDNEKVLRSDSISKNIVLYDPSIKIINFATLSSNSLNRVHLELLTINLKDLLKKYNIKYVLVENEEELKNFYPWINSETQQIDRNTLISGVNSHDNSQELNNIIYNETFELETIFPEYLLYRVKK